MDNFYLFYIAKAENDALLKDYDIITHIRGYHYELCCTKFDKNGTIIFDKIILPSIVGWIGKWISRIDKDDNIYTIGGLNRVTVTDTGGVITGEGPDELHYMKLNTDCEILIPDKIIAINSPSIYVLDFAVDSIGNSYIVTRNENKCGSSYFQSSLY